MNIKQQIKKLTDKRYHQYKLFIGKTKNPTYVIRFFDREGLMSILYKALGHIEYALDNGYVPYVDMEHFANMYRQKGVNAWECFFEQPIAENAGGGYSRKRIISACWPPRNNRYLFGKYWADAFCDYEPKGLFFEEHIKIERSILESVDKIAEEKDINECIGVLLRGTDYTSLKPKGHPVQPDVDEAMIKIDEFKKKYGGKIFLVTEDAQIRQKLQEKYEDELIIIEDDFTVSGYKEGKMLADCINSEKAIEVGKTYLLKIRLLSRCNYLVAGKTNGSLMALIMNKGQYKDTFIFDKGFYG